MKMEEKEFNLLHEPWIMVMLPSGSIQEMSILDTFKKAHEIKKITGELPTQDIAIIRLLLAIMHAAFVGDNIENPQDAKQLWQELWELKQFPYDIIEKYLTQYENRFWLFHPEFPFYQVADMAKSTEYSTKKLIGSLSESANKIRFFSERADIGKEQVSYAEGARWLLHVNAFDDTSAKPTQKGLESPGAGWLGKLGLVYAQGETLFETLLLNFVLLDDRNEIFDDNSATAYWEQIAVSCKERIKIAQPRAQKELLTLQSRRMQLNRENGVIKGYRLLGGDFFDKENALNEQMTLWKRDDKLNVYSPKRHQSMRQLWRDIAALLPVDHGDREAGVVHWLKFLKDNELYRKNLINLCITGIEYGDKDFFADGIISDSIQINSSFLKKVNETWVNSTIKLVQQTDKAVAYLGYLALDIATAEGNSGDSKDKKRLAISANARAKGYIKLDKAFREWLVNINPETEMLEDKELEWLEIARKIILTEGAKQLEKCSEKALIGCIKKETDAEKSTNAFAAFRRFKAGVVKILGQEVQNG